MSALEFTSNMKVPILDDRLNYAGDCPQMCRPRNFSTISFNGAYKVLPAQVANVVELSMTVYNNMQGIDALMQLNERRDPFDFELDDIIVVPDISYVASATLTASQALASTQPEAHGKTSKAQSTIKQPTNVSIAYNSGKANHAVVKEDVGKVVF